VQERFARPRLGSACRLGELVARLRRVSELVGRRCHDRSAEMRCSFR
jgi:hypothetical protein